MYFAPKRANIRILRYLLLSIFFLIPSQSIAGEFNAFGPQSYTRETGDPVSISKTFSILNPNTFYKIKINNGGLIDGEFEKVSSSIFILNGVQIVGPNEFNQNVGLIQRELPACKGGDESRFPYYGTGEARSRKYHGCKAVGIYLKSLLPYSNLRQKGVYYGEKESDYHNYNYDMLVCSIPNHGNQ